MTHFVFDVDVVSPQFPCGAAWLANALLELQVPLNHLWGFDTADEWQQLSDGTARYKATHLPWRQTLASLQLGRDFQFVENIKPRFSHAFPWQLLPEPAPRIIWMVRDPRDALYSEWRRHCRNEGLSRDVSFPEFLRQPFLGGPASVVDMLWLHLTAWQHVADALSDRVFLLRYEDWKRRPVESLKAVTNWVGLEVEGAEIESACLASDVSHLQAIEQSLMLKDANTRQFNRRGTVWEWEGTWPKEWYCAMGPEWADTLSRLGYAPLQLTGDEDKPCDLPAVLAWRELSDAKSVTKWIDILSPINAARKK